MLTPGASATRAAMKPTPPSSTRRVAIATRARTAFIRSLARGLQLGGLFLAHLLHLALDHGALERADVVDEQLVDEVIVLVLHRPRVEPFALGDELLAVEAGGAHARAQAALDGDEDAGERQATLF